LTKITIGADVRINADNHELFYGFADFYDRNGKRAGTYTLSNDKTWAFTPK
jgi:hypothetical protein